MKEIFDGIFEREGRLYTENLAPGISVYGEKLVKVGGKEYREWDPYRSKAAGALKKGLTGWPLKRNHKVLYLGASTGTTVSHFSDILREGVVFAVEVSPHMMQQLVERVAKYRENVVPILADARKVESYREIGEVDVLYQDVAQRDQAEIFVKNSNTFLRKGGWGMLCVKSQSIDVTREPQEVFEEVKAKLSPHFEIVEEVELYPYDKEHLFLLLRKR